MPALMMKSQKTMSSLALMLAVLAILLAVAMRSTPCASAASGSCSVGDTETFASGITVNEDGADSDTRLEGDTDINLLYIDAGNDRVGIGTNTPGALFSVDGALTTTTITTTTLTATGGGSLTGTWADMGIVTTIDINGGTINGITDLAVPDGGTGAGTFTDHGVLVGSGAGAFSVTATGASGEVLTSNGASSDPTFQAAAAGGGITEADQWRLHTTFTGNADPITSNLERNDSATFEKIGTGVDGSTTPGTFVFPSTGIWRVEFDIWSFADGGTDNNYSMAIKATLNNLVYNTIAAAENSHAGQFHRAHTHIQTIVDVTSVANVKVQFSIEDVETGNQTIGYSDVNRTYMTFTRLGDT